MVKISRFLDMVCYFLRIKLCFKKIGNPFVEAGGCAPRNRFVGAGDGPTRPYKHFSENSVISANIVNNIKKSWNFDHTHIFMCEPLQKYQNNILVYIIRKCVHILTSTMWSQYLILLKSYVVFCTLSNSQNKELYI